jgi:hypothetical protein
MSISRCLLAVDINCCTILPALFLAFLACAAAGFTHGDVAPGLARTPLTTQEILWIFAQVMGIAALAALPSLVLLSFINQSISRVTFRQHIEGRAFGRRSISSSGSFGGSALRRRPFL